MLKTDSKTLRMTIAALFVAIIVVMDVIPQVGFFSYGAISITFLIIPVAVGAYLLGAGWGALF
ncbi:MAG: ECF transporter S component, partial [Clostridia bacterium]|nr:ECF transporter S component [Clostridia bacterium]